MTTEIEFFNIYLGIAVSKAADGTQEVKFRAEWEDLKKMKLEMIPEFKKPDVWFNGTPRIVFSDVVCILNDIPVIRDALIFSGTHYDAAIIVDLADVARGAWTGQPSTWYPKDRTGEKISNSMTKTITSIKEEFHKKGGKNE